MSRATRFFAVVVTGGALLASMLSLPAQLAGAAGPAGAHPPGWGTPRKAGPHVMPVTRPGAHPAVPAATHLNYYDGPVLSNMKSLDVSYGPGTFISAGHPGASTIASFSSDWLSSGVVDWLNEYDTNIAGGTNQLIGRGSSLGAVTITPSSANNGSTIQDSQIQAELNAQITAGSLPEPDANTSYALFFRTGQTICMQGLCSGQQFCAYHSTFTAPNGMVSTYQVMPDLTTISGCGASSSVLNNTTSVLSHEMAETITDPEVGFASTVGPPLAWYDPANGEIGDICNAQQGTFTGPSGTWTVQKLWSNAANSCIVTRAVSSDFSISASPASLTVAHGGSGTSTISTAVTSGSAGTVNLTVGGALGGVTAGVSPTSVTAGGSAILTVSVDGSAPPGSYILTVQGTEGAVTHSTTVTVTVPTPSAMVSPNTGPPGTAVTVSGAGFTVGETVKVTYKTGLASPVSVLLCTTTAASDGTFSCSAAIPAKPTAGAKGAHKIVVKGLTSLIKLKITFTRT